MCGCDNCFIPNISVGDKFGHLTVIDNHKHWIHRKSKNKERDMAVLCECDCENKTKKFIKVYDLTSERVTSCGCLLEHHGLSHTKVYQQWEGMKKRCNNPHHVAYKNYGGRGISVCDEWNKSFASYYKWLIDNGYKDGLTIERIDNDGDYCPENCTLISRAEQQKNRRICINMTYNGQTKILADWSRESGIPYAHILKRYHENPDPEYVLKEWIDNELRSL